MSTEQEESGGLRRLLLAGDAFLFASALFIIGSLLLVGVNYATGALNQDTRTASASALAIQGGSLIVSLLAVGFGAALAWRLHGRAFTPMVALFMAIGVVIGVPIAFGALTGSVALIRLIPIGGEGPPWIAIGLLAAAVIALLVMPLVDAVRDTRGAGMHIRLDLLRWIALAIVIAIAVIVAPVIGAIGGTEEGEIGVFMVPFAAAASLAVLGGDLYCGYRDRHSRTAAATA